MKALAVCVGMTAWLVAAYPALADKTWKSSVGTGDWFFADNWVEGSYPTNGDSVVITSAGAYVLLTNSTDPLASLVIGNATLSFTN